MKTKPIQTALTQSLGSKHPKLSGFKSTTLSDTIASKLVEGINTNPRSYDGSNRAIAAPQHLVTQVANKTATNVVDSENMMQLLPDLELAKQVMVSSILSPNDLISTALTYGSTADDLGEVKALLVDVIKDYFENSYKIKTLLPRMLEEALFTKGAYPIAVIPESSIDEAINSTGRVSLESLRDELTANDELVNYGILGNAKTTKTPGKLNFGLESYDTQTPYVAEVPNLYLSVTDNISVLKFPRLHEKLVADRVQDAYAKKQMSMELYSSTNKTDDNITRESLYRPRNFNFTPVLTIKTLSQLDKPTVGHPLVMTLPTESVIPVHVPSAPEEHIGYFIVIDKHGNPVRASSTQDFYADLSYNTGAIRDMSSQLLAQTRRASEGRKQNSSDEIALMDEAMQMYTDVVENDLISRLQNGIYGENVKVSRPTEIYRMMFARACSRMMTQLVYIPLSLMTYIAFDYNSNGVGKSLLEATKILGSIRAMLLFANTVAAIKNSVNHVVVNIELDPADPSPDRTVEFLMGEYAKTRQASYPIGASSPVDIVNYLQNAGVEVVTSGHPGYPETKVTVEDKQANHTKVDTDLDEMLKKRQLMAVGMAPETVDLSMNVEFATSVVSSNVLLAKRAMVYQVVFTAHLVDHMQKFTCNSKVLMDALREIIDNNREMLSLPKDSKASTDSIAMYFINSLTLTLPEPDLAQVEMQMAAFENYTKGLDATLPAFVSSEMFDSTLMGEVANAIPQTIAILKAQFQRQWLQNNNVMPELFKLVTFSDEDGPAFDLLKEHDHYMLGIQKSLVEFMRKSIATSTASDKALADVRDAVGADAADAGGGDDSGGDDTGGDADSGGDTGDDGDFDMGGEGDTEATDDANQADADADAGDDDADVDKDKDADKDADKAVDKDADKDDDADK